MSLHDELTRATVVPCKVCGYLATLHTAEAQDWARELALPIATVGNTAVVIALARRGVDVTETSVRRHRAKHGRPV